MKVSALKSTGGRKGSVLSLNRQIKPIVQDTKANEIEEITEENDPKKNSLKSSMKQYSSRKKNAIFSIICIIITVLLAMVAVGAVVTTVLFNFYKPVIITTTVAPTTTRYGNLTKLAVGQSCLYSNQCPDRAFCSGTCRCPLHNYYDSTSATCTLRKTNAAVCTADFECNQAVGLRCVSGTCQCETITQLWNSTYFALIGAGGTGGRCQNKKGHGMYCTASEGKVGIVYGIQYSSPIRRCYCDPGASTTLDLLTGNCKYGRRMTDDICRSGNECYTDELMCVDLARSGKKRCIAVPSLYYWASSFIAKLNNGVGCNPPSSWCNDNKGLYCNRASGLCECMNKYNYYNGSVATSMCLRGSRYGDVCTVATQCTPTTSGMVCDFPFTGASYKSCRCTIGTQYYDYSTETCKTLKTFNASCADSTECAGSATNIMYCGMYAKASQLRCICADGYYPSGTTCVVKLARGVSGCTQDWHCMDHLGQTCISGTCNCVSTKYYETSTQSCKAKKYVYDGCTTGSECWSGSCNSPTCN